MNNIHMGKMVLLTYYVPFLMTIRTITIAMFF